MKEEEFEHIIKGSIVIVSYKYAGRISQSVGWYNGVDGHVIELSQEILSPGISCRCWEIPMEKVDSVEIVRVNLP